MSIIIGIAAIPSRESALIQSISSLYNQADIIHLALNGFKKIPNFLKRLTKVNPVLTSNDKGDTNKYLHIENYSNDYYFSCDDDLIYPKNYIEHYIKNIDKYQSLITVHGSLLPDNEIKSYFKNRIFVSHYGIELKENKKIHIAGTGVSGFHTSQLKLKYSDFLNANMADIFVAIACEKQNVKRIAISHPDKWIQDANYNSEKTLYKKHRLNDSIQTKHINSIQWKK